MGLEKKTFDSNESEAISHPKAVRKTKLYEQIVHQIRLLIEDGRLKDGDQLPTERNLAEIFKVSRHSVREAIRILEQQHVLSSRPGSGTFVIVENEGAVVEALAAAIHREKIKLSEIFQFRRLIEPQIAGLAAENATEEHLAKLQRVYTEHESAINDISEAAAKDLAFHLTLAEASGNSVLQSVLKLLTDILRESREEYSQSESRRRLSLKGHSRILKAITRSNPKEAIRAMETHLKGIESIVIQKKDNPYL